MKTTNNKAEQKLINSIRANNLMLADLDRKFKVAVDQATKLALIETAEKIKAENCEWSYELARVWKVEQRAHW